VSRGLLGGAHRSAASGVELRDLELRTNLAVIGMCEDLARKDLRPTLIFGEEESGFPNLLIGCSWMGHSSAVVACSDLCVGAGLGDPGHRWC